VKGSHWNKHYKNWARLGPPLSPHADVVAAMREVIKHHASRVLLLGVTPKLADLGDELIAVDKNPEMIAHIWPGNTAKRRAQLGDWLRLDLPDGSFTAAAGDGVLNMLDYPQGHSALYESVARMLRPGGIFVCRVFATPAQAESLEEVAAKARDREIVSFNAFKWHVAMALAASAGNPNVPVAAIRDWVNHTFPDRHDLVLATGWDRMDIETIDAYENSEDVYSFPTIAEFRAVIPATFGNVQIVPSGDYPIAERCPLLVAVRVQ
jgi:SAM-dependent methyltransferase